jgi:hypothetical protein
MLRDSRCIIPSNQRPTCLQHPECIGGLPEYSLELLVFINDLDAMLVPLPTGRLPNGSEMAVHHQRRSGRMFSVARPSVPVDVECRRHGGTTPRELANKIICEREVDATRRSSRERVHSLFSPRLRKPSRSFLRMLRDIPVPCAPWLLLQASAVSHGHTEMCV